MRCSFAASSAASFYALSLHDALPIWPRADRRERVAVLGEVGQERRAPGVGVPARLAVELAEQVPRSEEHTSELQSQFHLVCRRLLEKKKYFDAGEAPPRPRAERVPTR